MAEWILILTLGISTTLISNDAGTSAGRVTVPMQSREACLKAARADYPGLGETAVCINTKTGEVEK